MHAVVAFLTAISFQIPAPIRGFPRSMVADEVRREQTARLVPHADTLRALLRSYSAEPHEAGTERSRRVAEQILARFRGMGLDARIEQFDALMPRPVARTLELVAPERYTAQLQEPPLPQDPTTSQTATQLPTFNAYSPDGDVTAELVYVNYGVPDDYRVLDSLGISVRGKIVIARYGRSWRGVQRGSVMDMPTYPGDPLSPACGSVPGGRRLPMAEVKTLEPIPVLPISYGDAQPLLKNLGG